MIDGATAGNLSLAQPTSPISRSRRSGESFGVIGIAFGIGFLIGPASRAFWRSPITAIRLRRRRINRAEHLATSLLLPKATPARTTMPAVVAGRLGRVREIFRDPRLATRLWQFLCFIFAFAMFTSGFPLFAERRFSFGPNRLDSSTPGPDF